MGQRKIPYDTPLLMLANSVTKPVHDYSLLPITKKADNPIDNIGINIE